MSDAGRVAVIGGGVIGTSVAWRCAQRGLPVTLYDQGAGAGASTVAAGMLAPVSEAYFGEAELTALLVASAGLWPEFAAELREFGDVGYRTDGTLVVALTADDLAQAARLWTYQESLGLPVSRLTNTELRQRELALHPRVRSGALVGDHQADPRRLLATLRTAVAAAGVQTVSTRVASLSELDADTVVVAAGTGTAALTGLPVRPVKGQVVRLRAPAGEPGFGHVIRGFADTRRVYLVPRRDGEVVVGASEEERTDPIPTAGAVLELLRSATDLVPELTEYELAEVTVGHRPGTPDNAPIIGEFAGPGAATGTGRGSVPAAGDRPATARRIVVASGHYRHGILLAPITADTVTELVATGKAPELIARYAPDRFPTGEQPVSAEGRNP